jgi:hypothetical protein
MGLEIICVLTYTYIIPFHWARNKHCLDVVSISLEINSSVDFCFIKPNFFMKINHRINVSNHTPNKIFPQIQKTPKEKKDHYTSLVNVFGHGRKDPPQVANKFEGRRKLIIYFQMGFLNPKP